MSGTDVEYRVTNRAVPEKRRLLEKKTNTLLLILLNVRYCTYYRRCPDFVQPYRDLVSVWWYQQAAPTLLCGSVLAVGLCLCYTARGTEIRYDAIRKSKRSSQPPSSPGPSSSPPTPPPLPPSPSLLQGHGSVHTLVACTSSPLVPDPPTLNPTRIILRRYLYPSTPVSTCSYTCISTSLRHIPIPICISRRPYPYLDMRPISLLIMA
eukprot:2724577-Rhodomonas_salina.2